MPLEPAGTDTVLSRLLDAVLDVAVVSFALWTLLYGLGLATQWSLWPSGWVWLAGTLLVAVLLVAERLRWLRGTACATEGPASDPQHPRPSPQTSAGRGDRTAPVRSALLPIGLLLVMGSGAGVWLADGSDPAFQLVWAMLLLGTCTLAVWAALAGRFHPARPSWAQDCFGPPPAGSPAPRRRPASLSDFGVIVAALAVAALTSRIHLPNTDDVYYVNRAAWVAERGTAALRDTIFGPEVYDSVYGGGVPLASVEALIGVLAHMTGTLAGTVTFVVTPPVAGFLSVLALWRLARRWAPRRPLLVLLGSLAFLLLGGDSMISNFWIPRIWQGKVLAVAILIPLMWAYLTELAAARSRRDRMQLAGLLLAAGIALVGLTPTSAIWGPVMLGAGLAAAAVARSAWLAIGSVALAVGPLVGAAAVVISSTGVGGSAPVALTPRASFVRVLGESLPMVALAVVALGVAVVLARRGAGAALAGASSVASLLVLAPGVPALLNTLTGSGPILWRLLFVAPLPVLVGLLLAVPLPARRPAAAPSDAAGPGTRPSRPAMTTAVAVVCLLGVVGALVAGGQPIWQYAPRKVQPTLESARAWKVDLSALADVRSLIDSGVDGRVLLPPRPALVLPMYTTVAHPVALGRTSFMAGIEESQEQREARLVLLRVAQGERPLPSPDELRRALEVLEVDLVCAGRSRHRDRVMALYSAAGYSDVDRYGSLTCARTTGAGSNQ